MSNIETSLHTPTIEKLRKALADLDSRTRTRQGGYVPPSQADREHRENVRRKLWNAVCDRLGVKGVLVYSSNNSGGSWWLSDADWRAMQEAGWSVHWMAPPREGQRPYESGGTSGYEDDPVTLLTRYEHDGRSEWLGCHAKSAAIPTNDPAGTVDAWERITGQNAGDEGCNCCGNPHTFEFRDRDGESHYSSIRVTSTFEGFDL